MQTANYFDDTAVAVMSCPGRVRIKVPRLYRSHAEKDKLEAALSAHKNIVAVYANPLTGKLLLLFDLSISPDTILLGLGLTVPSVAKPVSDARKMRSTGKPRATAFLHRRQPVRQREMYAPWHLREAQAAVAFHQSSMQSGLASALVEHRLKHGLNILPQRRPPSSLDIFLNQFKSLPVLLLGISAGLSLLTGGIAEAIAITAVLAMNGTIGFVTERRAESTIASLSELIDDIVPVLRNGQVLDVQASRIVPGDMLVLAPGVRIAADARVVRATGLRLDESALTGESRFVAKDGNALERPVVLAERSNMVYMGTAVTAGSGLAVVVGAGRNTEIGAIQMLMNNTEQPRTPIQKQLDQLGNRLVGISLGICASVFAIGLLRGQGLLQMFKSAISLAIAAVPEGLPTVATTSLARGIRMMRERQMLIRRLQALETLGAIHTICLDKTGTLTMNHMSAVALHVGTQQYELVDGQLRWQDRTLQESAGAEVARLLQICVLCNENGARNGATVSSVSNGSATEKALMNLAQEAGVQASGIHDRYPILQTELRAEGRNYMKTVHASPGADSYLIAVKGSPMEVLELCDCAQSGEQIVALMDEMKAEVERKNAQMAERQLRVLGFAYGERKNDGHADNDKLVWVGLIGLADPLRAGAERVIAEFHRAGIRTVMITGDQSATAQAIGKSLGLANGREPHVLESDNLERMEEHELKHLASEADIFARVSPAHKLRIVQALQESGNVVAMTGDGINDGPALQAANVGIAMGLQGTDIARSAADVVLKDDRLETVLDAIRQGRTITGNIEKSLHFLISSNLSEILLVLGAISTTGTAPLTPMQILWINLLSDVLPAIALAAEPTEADVMQRPPRDAAKPLIGNTELKGYALEGTCLAGGALGSYFYGIARYGMGPRAGTIGFNALMLGQLLHALTCRSERPGIFSGTAGKTNQLNLAIGGSIGLQILANLVPGLRGLLGTARMSMADVAITLAGAGIPLVLNEAAKKRRNHSQDGFPLSRE